MKEDLVTIVLSVQLQTKDSSSNSEVKELRAEMHELKTQMLELLSKMNMLSQTRTADQGELGSHTVPLATPPTFADIVRSTVKNTIKEEKAQAQVVISNAKEEDSDLQFMSSLCEKISQKSMSKKVSRMGTKSADRVRPMIVTFDSIFDARTFMSRFDDSKSDDDVLTPPIKILLYRTREDQTMYKKKLEMARELNKKAKDESPNISFSLRNNGCIWKYIKDADCNKWRRDLEWSDLEDRDNTKHKESMSGNDYGTAQHNTHPLMEDDMKKRWHSAS
ncbi:hypothetical protein CAPTEDRAFT_185844 [Capitella teleta]|uniref:Uncharacterized protein n=1 Tax=Capitella teleta TaxID=283909 RepID=R7UAY3_CAPTE|nr:hypothetical protein CAPTEDRAFT_185844 [Capitella teleta]|eukprot:ELU03510.1 hypothetical protein CAPTEDRAFT_185844 [Capitella teleta]